MHQLAIMSTRLWTLRISHLPHHLNILTYLPTFYPTYLPTYPTPTQHQSQVMKIMQVQVLHSIGWH
jgi:hypothetical protein